MRAGRRDTQIQPKPTASPEIRLLPDGTLLVFLSDSHIGGDPGHDIFESPEELTALLDELAGHDGPVELVLAGDFFDFLEIGEVLPGADRASVTVSRPEYQQMFAALRRFAATAGRHVVYLPGNHDAEVWWNPAIRETLRREGLVHAFAFSYAASFASQPDRIIYCEHGNQFDPANTVLDYDDPLDTPLGHHIVTDVTRRIVPTAAARGERRLQDINKVYPLVAIPDWLASRLFYDLLTQVGRWGLLPFFLAYAAFLAIASLVSLRQESPKSYWHSDRMLRAWQRLFGEIGYDGALLLAAFGTFFIGMRRQTRRAVATTTAQLPGLAPSESVAEQMRRLLDSDQPLPMSGDLTGREIAAVVTGHTHAPSLTEVSRPSAAAVIVNSGCWLRQLRPVRAHGGVPPVFVSTFVLTHVRVSLKDSGVRVELWEHPKPSVRRLRLAERIAILGRLPAQPPADVGPRIVAATELPKAIKAR